MLTLDTLPNNGEEWMKTR